ncbi:hypothetical protein I6A60_24820 [Frankia sp. AgB1.9]|uniref:hypothetical protein n=1 Tax=unclassified Frankia TaxID=2632575 RepID=UPI00193203A7|nr:MULTISPECIES: hypothetical protein [unclassified Frankia]MBL7487418.1 hypothetical protein [Frankia sp. AgW1.1]MBL7551064.1 hypothetical protein [Frankia sp. AgB1.9]MBL7618845.1 hypothetical protein [Frankia sp. AgB1.8]
MGALLGNLSTATVRPILEAMIGLFVTAFGDRLHDLLAGLFSSSTRPQVTAASFVAGDGPYHTVALFSTVLLIGTLVLGVIQGLLSGEPGQAFARLVRQVPVAVLAIGGFPWLVDQMLSLADVLAEAVLPAAQGRQLADVMAAPPSTDVPGLLVTVVAFCGGVLLTMELVVRDGLVMVVVALAPLSFAASVMPAARAAAGEVVKLTAAVVLAKPAIFVALRIGIDQLHQSQNGSALGTVVSGTGTANWGPYLLGLTVLVVAACMPFVVWRLMPLAEAYALAQGVSRAPFRAAQSAAQLAYYSRFLSGGGGGRPGALPGGGAGRPDRPGGERAGTGGFGPPRTLPDPPPAARAGRRGGRPGAQNPPGPEVRPPVPNPPPTDVQRDDRRQRPRGEPDGAAAPGTDQ